MLISAAVKNCIIIIKELQGQPNPVPSYKIVQKHNLSQAFIDQLCRKLRVAGFIKAFRGNNGGYMLTEAGKQVTLLELLDLLSKWRSGSTNIEVTGPYINKIKSALAEVTI